MQEEDRKWLEDYGLHVSKDQLSHAYLLLGEEEEAFGLAMLLAEGILTGFGSKEGDRPVDRAGDDLIVIDQDKIPIDTVRYLTKQMYRKPLYGDSKVLVINRAGLMKAEAQNALLKSLEEPPAGVVWILVTNNGSKLLPTIRSRCRMIYIRRESEDLEGRYPFEDKLVALLEAALSGDLLPVFTDRAFYDDYKDEKLSILVFISGYLQGLLRYKAGVEDGAWTPSYRKMNKTTTIDQLSDALLETEKLRQLLDVNINFPLALEHLFLSLGRGGRND